MEPKPTIGVDFATREVEVDGKYLKVNIWDTASNEKYRALTSAYYRGCHGAMLVYDITRRQTFINLQTWLNEIHEYSPQNTIIMIVGNKSDLEHLRTVSTDEARSWAQKFLFLEISALSASNVELAFYELVRAIYEQKADPNVIRLRSVRESKTCCYI
jgi:small GTP-binding protein